MQYLMMFKKKCIQEIFSEEINLGFHIDRDKEETMVLHIFNPEHDMALAANQKRFTAPHAGRQMRADLGFLPALWSEDGDILLVDDEEAAKESLRHLGKFAHKVKLVSLKSLKELSLATSCDFKIDSWGWDCTIKEQLLKADSQLEPFMPSDSQLVAIRTLSNRKFAAENLLPLLTAQNDMTIGESRYCESLDEMAAMMSKYGKSVLKAPWSCSGRGVRYSPQANCDARLLGWANNIIRQQGGIMVEPLYNKTYDFGLEFYANEDGDISYCGLSLFHTSNNAYTGNLLATESDKRKILSHYINIDIVDAACDNIRNILSTHLKGVYSGAFGIDMMVVAQNGGKENLLHPCVEMNLRRTMGHLSLALTPSIHEPQRIMSIYYADKYRIRIQNTTRNLLNTNLI